MYTIVIFQRDCYQLHSGSEDDEPELTGLGFVQENAMQEVKMT